LSYGRMISDLKFKSTISVSGCQPLCWQGLLRAGQVNNQNGDQRKGDKQTDQHESIRLARSGWRCRFGLSNLREFLDPDIFGRRHHRRFRH